MPAISPVFVCAPAGVHTDSSSGNSSTNARVIGKLVKVYSWPLFLGAERALSSGVEAED